MVEETIKSIRETENKADQIVKEAEQESKRILKTAKEEAKQAADKLIDEAKSDALKTAIRQRKTEKLCWHRRRKKRAEKQNR